MSVNFSGFVSGPQTPWAMLNVAANENPLTATDHPLAATQQVTFQAFRTAVFCSECTHSVAAAYSQELCITV